MRPIFSYRDETFGQFPYVANEELHGKLLSDGAHAGLPLLALVVDGGVGVVDLDDEDATATTLFLEVFDC